MAGTGVVCCSPHPCSRRGKCTRIAPCPGEGEGVGEGVLEGDLVVEVAEEEAGWGLGSAEMETAAWEGLRRHWGCRAPRMS